MLGVAGLGLGGAATLLVLSAQWGVQLMLNPDALPWLQSWLWPSSSMAEAAIALPELAAAIATQGHQLGEPVIIYPTADIPGEYWIIPIQAPPSPGSSAPPEILELRSYQRLPKQPVETLLPLATLEVHPLAESEILAPLLGTPLGTSQKQLSTLRQWPMTQLSPLASVSPGEGIWLTLQGRWQQGSTQIRYGQMVYFSPQQSALAGLITWSSPANQLPQAVDLDGRLPMDWMVDETVGLEPALRGYLCQASVGIGPVQQLLPVSLHRGAGAALSGSASPWESTYQQALLLARKGLWSDALRQLHSLKPKMAAQWNPGMEAQLRWIQLHAERTRAQADRTWSTPSQKILALVIDGRWAPALTLFEKTPAAQATVMQFLAEDEGRFWNRVTATLRWKPGDTAALVWGGLILTAQQNQAAALAWLAQQKAPPAVQNRFQNTVKTAAVPGATTSVGTSMETPLPAGGSTAIASAPVTAMIGVARPVSQPNFGQWQPSEATQKLGFTSRESWYEVDLVAWQQEGRWQARAGGSQPWNGDPPAHLWAVMAPALRGWLTLLVWGEGIQARPLTLTAKGLRLQGNRVQVLASGAALPYSGTGRSPLVFSENSLVWLNPREAIAASEAAVLPPLQQLLEPYLAPAADTDLLTLLPQLQVHRLDVTGDGQPEQIITLDREALNTLANWQVPCDRTAPKTIILADTGQPLYDDLFSPQTLVALTHPNGTVPLALLIEQNRQYQLQTNF